jgi:hypothetical protein
MITLFHHPKTRSTRFIFLLEELGAPYEIRRVVDRKHGSALTAWRAMGRPAEPTFEQSRVLREAARLPPPRIVPLHGASPQLSLRLLAHALALVRLER